MPWETREKRLAWIGVAHFWSPGPPRYQAQTFFGLLIPSIPEPTDTPQLAVALQCIAIAMYFMFQIGS
jgi:hypothetical protein